MAADDELTLILLPGLNGTGMLFLPLLAQLPSYDTPRVVSFPGDVMLGYGQLLRRVFHALPSAGPFVVLGESFSGPLALMAAAQAPAGLRWVI